MNEKAGVAEAPAERLSPTIAMVDAALRLWEAKQNKGRTFSVWTRSAQKSDASPSEQAG
ncbi:MAG: hypothetical protein ABI946_07625 [Chthoniobacterales bacterium]